MCSPDEGNLKGKIRLIFAFTTAASIVWIYFRIPKTAGRSSDELDAMFAARVPSGRFKVYKR